MADNLFDALEVTEKVEPFLTELGSVSNRTTQSSPKARVGRKGDSTVCVICASQGQSIVGSGVTCC